MSLIIADRVKETAPAPGAGSISLGGAVTGFRAFSAAVGNGNTCYYSIWDGASLWEVGFGTYSTSGNSLARNTVLSSSNSNSKVTFNTGAVTVWSDAPAAKLPLLDASGNMAVPGQLNVTGNASASDFIGQSYNTGGSGVRLEMNAPGVTDGSVVAQFFGAHTDFFYVCDGESAGYNVTASVLLLGACSTGRSLNAGGTVNASGSDYAEYELKENSCGDIAKGQIVGFNDRGEITTSWWRAKSFGIKTTDPSYVGGDTWGNEDAIGSRPGKDATSEEIAAYQAKQDAARVNVDRIAYSGKVPVNVYGAMVGDYIVASQDVNDGICGVAKANLSFGEYQCAVGRVRAILPDGRAYVAVIVH